MSVFNFTILLSYRAIRVFLVQKFSCPVPTQVHEPSDLRWSKQDGPVLPAYICDLPSIIASLLALRISRGSIYPCSKRLDPYIDSHVMTNSNMQFSFIFERGKKQRAIAAL